MASKEQQLRELREARLKHPNPLEDAARGRDPVLAAKPATAEATHGSRGVGRTTGSNPVTGAKREFKKPLAKDADKTLMATKPWETEGVSRRTWYRRQNGK
jgi:hypothetical protein